MSRPPLIAPRVVTFSRQRVLATVRSVRAHPRILVVGGSIVLAMLIYLPSITSAFQFDDISHWRTVRPFRGPWELLGHWYPVGPGAGVWRPLFDVAWWLEIALFGTDGTFFHVANVALHGAAAGLVGVLAFEVTGGKPAAAIFGAGLLLVQPFPEAVAWNTGALLSVTSTICYLLAVSAVVHYAAVDQRPRTLAAGLVAFALSLGFYEVALAGPLWVSVCALTLGNRPWRERVKLGVILAVAFGSVSLAYLSVRRLLIGSWVGAYGAGTILGFDRTADRLAGVLSTIAKPVHFTTSDRTWEQPLLALYWLGLVYLFVVFVLMRPNFRVALFTLTFALAAFLPFIGFIAVNDVLISTRYLYPMIAGLALTIAVVLATSRRLWLGTLAFLCLFGGLLGLLGRNEMPWRESGGMVASTMRAASEPIQVFGVPLHNFEGGYTFGTTSELSSYPGGAGVNVTLGGSVRPDRKLLYWNGEQLVTIGPATRTFTAAELAGWQWADTTETSLGSSGLIIRSLGNDPYALAAPLDIDGGAGQLLTLAIDLRDGACARGQVIWRTVGGVDHLSYYDLEPGYHTYVVLAPSGLRRERVAGIRLDPILCPGVVVMSWLGVGGIVSASH